MTDLRHPLEDLVAEVPSYVVPDPRRAWSEGARRRVRRRIGIAGLVAVLVVLAAGIATQLPRSSDLPPADVPGGGVGGYPTRVERPWSTSDLPAQSGPLAAAVWLSDGSFRAVSPTGEVWRVPQERRASGDFFPSLSVDGRMIGYLVDNGTYLVRDLVTGEETRYPQIGDNAAPQGGRSETWMTAPQAPGFWSPDDSMQLLAAWRWDDDRGPEALLLAKDGSVREVPQRAPYGRLGEPVGWLDAQRLGWLKEGRGRTVPASFIVTRLDGSPISTFALDLPRRQARDLSQWSGSISPDGSRLAVVLDDDVASHQVVTFSTEDGSVVDRTVLDDDPWQPCGLSWQGDEVVVPYLSDSGARIDSLAGETLVVTDPAFDAYCVMTAGDALAGHRHDGVAGTLFGTRTGWLSWHWREIAAVLAGLIVLTAAALGFRRRRSAAEDDRDPGDGAGGAAPGDPAVVE